jgi:hypothetical protein
MMASMMVAQFRLTYLYVDRADVIRRMRAEESALVCDVVYSSAVQTVEKVEERGGE